MADLTIEEIAAVVDGWRYESARRQERFAEAVLPSTLEQEFAGYFHALGRREAELAHSHGVSQADIMNGLVGVARVRITGDGRWTPDEQGARMFVTPVRVEPGARRYDIESPNPRLAAARGEIIDIVAWRPRVPSRWALRTGEGLVLGAAEYRLSDEPSSALRVTQGPVEWLRSHGDGIGLLTLAPEDQRRLLFGIEKIAVDDPKLREDLQRLVGPQTAVEEPCQKETESARPLQRRTVALRA